MLNIFLNILIACSTFSGIRIVNKTIAMPVQNAKKPIKIKVLINIDNNFILDS